MTKFDLQELTYTLPRGRVPPTPSAPLARLRSPTPPRTGFVATMPPSPLLASSAGPPVPAWPTSPPRRSSPRRGRRPDCERTRPQPAGADGRAVPVPEPLRGPVAEADHYATLYPRRAALPAKCDFAPPEAYPVHAIVTDSARPCERSTVPRRPPCGNLACPPLSPRAPLSPPQSNETVSRRPAECSRENSVDLRRMHVFPA